MRTIARALVMTTMACGGGAGGRPTVDTIGNVAAAGVGGPRFVVVSEILARLLPEAEPAEGPRAMDIEAPHQLTADGDRIIPDPRAVDRADVERLAASAPDPVDRAVLGACLADDHTEEEGMLDPCPVGYWVSEERGQLVVRPEPPAAIDAPVEVDAAALRTRAATRGAGAAGAAGWTERAVPGSGRSPSTALAGARPGARAGVRARSR
ncbi:MAG: hypothetical protein R2939_12595 [Kofleriaceae bacterium]